MAGLTYGGAYEIFNKKYAYWPPRDEIAKRLGGNIVKGAGICGAFGVVHSSLATVRQKSDYYNEVGATMITGAFAKAINGGTASSIGLTAVTLGFFSFFYRAR